MILNDSDNYNMRPIIWASSKKMEYCDETHIGSTAMSLTNSANSDKIKFVLQKWPIAMAILIFKELSVYHQTDASTLIDLYQYIQAEERLLLYR